MSKGSTSAMSPRFASAILPSRLATSDIVVQSDLMRRLYQLAHRVAPSQTPVLVTGETGVGKELVVRALHEWSERPGRLVFVNCGALPQYLVEAIWFGHERGSFTGAIHRQTGVFEQAIGGTLCLDEIGELSLSAQATLLRAIETKRITRLGGSREIAADVRIVACTHRDLARMTTAGTFRQDLYYRLNAVTLAVPALRERRDEILPLAQLFLRKTGATLTHRIDGFDDGVCAALQRHDWPGNVRELKNAVERAAVFCDRSLISLDVFSPDVRPGRSHESGTHVICAERGEPATRNGTFRSAVREFERNLLRSALEEAAGNRSRAAALLGLPVRTFHRKLQELGCTRLNLSATESEPGCRGYHAHPHAQHRLAHDHAARRES